MITAKEARDLLRQKKEEHLETKAGAFGLDTEIRAAIDKLRSNIVLDITQKDTGVLSKICEISGYECSFEHTEDRVVATIKW